MFRLSVFRLDETPLNETPLIAGVDEAGRGPLAGPVMAAAVILRADEKIAGLADSKQLSAKKRARLAETIREKALYWSIAQASVEEIDSMNILNATLLAMRRAIDELAMRVTMAFCRDKAITSMAFCRDKTLIHALIDGNQVPRDLPCTAKAIIKGDQTEPPISAASILAKTHRDRLMIALHDEYPNYGFAAHKGYGTRAHLQALEKLGPVASIHRVSFAPVRRLMDQALWEGRR